MPSLPSIFSSIGIMSKKPNLDRQCVRKNGWKISEISDLACDRGGAGGTGVRKQRRRFGNGLTRHHLRRWAALWRFEGWSGNACEEQEDGEHSLNAAFSRSQLLRQLRWTLIEEMRPSLYFGDAFTDLWKRLNFTDPILKRGRESQDEEIATFLHRSQNLRIRSFFIEESRTASITDRRASLSDRGASLIDRKERESSPTLQILSSSSPQKHTCAGCSFLCISLSRRGKTLITQRLRCPSGALTAAMHRSARSLLPNFYQRSSKLSPSFAPKIFTFNSNPNCSLLKPCVSPTQSSSIYAIRLRPTAPNPYSRRFICSDRPVEYGKEVDEINLKFAEAREEIDAALESKETVYFDEEAECAREAVKSTLDLYEGLLARLQERDRYSLQRSMGLKMEQLKAELKQLDD